MPTVNVTQEAILDAKLAGKPVTISTDEFKMLAVRDMLTFKQDAKTGEADMPHMYGVRIYVANSKVYAPPA